MSGVTTATIVAVAAVAVSAASTAYSVYSGMEAADEQRDALNEQKRQAMEAAGIQSEQQRKQGLATQAQARATAAAAGLALDDTNSTVGVIQKQIADDTQFNMDLTKKQAGWQTTNINNQINAIPSAGELIGKGALGFASTAMNSYSSYSNMQAQESLLARQNFSNPSSNWIQSQGSDFGTINYNSGASTQKLTLLG